MPVMDDEDFTLVSGFFGPGVLAAWYLTLVSVAISWVTTPARRFRASPDLIVALAYPITAIGHLLKSIIVFPADQGAGRFLATTLFALHIDPLTHHKAAEPSRSICAPHADASVDDASQQASAVCAQVIAINTGVCVLAVLATMTSALLVANLASVRWLRASHQRFAKRLGYLLSAALVWCWVVELALVFRALPSRTDDLHLLVLFTLHCVATIASALTIMAESSTHGLNNALMRLGVFSAGLVWYWLLVLLRPRTLGGGGLGIIDIFMFPAVCYFCYSLRGIGAPVTALTFLTAGPWWATLMTPDGETLSARFNDFVLFIFFMMQCVVSLAVMAFAVRQASARPSEPAVAIVLCMALSFSWLPIMELVREMWPRQGGYALAVAVHLVDWFSGLIVIFSSLLLVVIAPPVVKLTGRQLVSRARVRARLAELLRSPSDIPWALCEYLPLPALLLSCGVCIYAMFPVTVFFPPSGISIFRLDQAMALAIGMCKLGYNIYMVITED